MLAPTSIGRNETNKVRPTGVGSDALAGVPVQAHATRA